MQCDGPELRASTKPGFRTELACLPLESSCRLLADADRRASKTQFLKMSENRVRLIDSRSQRAVYCGSCHARRRSSSRLGLAWIMSELPTRALRISSTSNGVQRTFVLPIARRAAVQNSGHVPTKASNKTSNIMSNTKISCSFKLLIQRTKLLSKIRIGALHPLHPLRALVAAKLQHDPEGTARKDHAQSRIQSAIKIRPNPIALKPRVQPRAKMVTKAVEQLLGGFDGLHQFLCRCPVRR